VPFSRLRAIVGLEFEIGNLKFEISDASAPRAKSNPGWYAGACAPTRLAPRATFFLARASNPVGGEGAIGGECGKPLWLNGLYAQEEF
jgi:hypothetical protein